MNPEPLDWIPFWCFFLIVLVLGMLSVEVGYRLVSTYILYTGFQLGRTQCIL